MAKTKPKYVGTAQLKDFAKRVGKYQFVAGNPDMMLQHMQEHLVRDDQGFVTSDAFRYQQDLLKARHLFVSQGLRPREVARELAASGSKIPPNQVWDWMESFGWREMKERRMLRRTGRFQLVRQANAHMVERRADSLMSKAQMIIEEFYNSHLDGDLKLTPQELTMLVNATEKTFAVRGAIAGSDRVGEKLEIKLSTEVRHSLEEMTKVKAKEKHPLLDAPLVGIEIQDAEYDTVPAEMNAATA